jgi:methionyl-tRNA formyltransferase
MSKVRILFLGTPEFAVASLQRLIDDDHFEIVGVVSQPDRPAGRKMQLQPSPVKELALKHGLRVFTPETVNTSEFRDQMATLGAEAAAVVAFGQILGQKFLDLFRRGCVNVHASVLPRWRGAAPIQRAVMAGDQESGVALQTIVRKLDAGPLLGIRRIAIPDEMNAMQLHDELKVLGADLLHIEFMDYLRGNLQPLPQDETQVTIAPKIEKAEARIDWSQPARTVHNRVRGLQMGPFAFTTRAGSPLKIHRTRVVDESKSNSAGVVLSVDASSFVIGCGTGAVEVLEAQPESRARMSAADYMRGYPVKIGDRFE